MNHEQQWFPGLEPKKTPRPGKITVSYAEPMTIEEKEGIKDAREARNMDSDSRTAETRPIDEDRIPPPLQTEPICAPKQEAQGKQEKEPTISQKVRNGDARRAGIYFVKLSSSLLATLSALMSWYYSFEWFRDKLPVAWRFFLPIIIVGCSVMLPQVALIFLNKKGIKYKGTAFVVFLVGLLASGFSMLSTIAGIYNSNSASITSRSASIVSAQSDTDARAELKRISDELSRLNHEIDSTQAKVDSISTNDTLKPDSQALMRRLNSAKRGKQDYETQYKEAQKRIEAARATGSTAATVREDFNAFLGRQFKIDAGRVEFGMAAAPALLLDVVAPILSAVALFL